jgi:predicted PurR-regulated permease PerM
MARPDPGVVAAAGRVDAEDSMTFQRQLTFWLGTFVVVVTLLWLLSEILLPFVAGMALAYLLDPVTNRLQQIGISRAVAALLIIGVVVLVFILLILLIVPVLAEQLSALIANIPTYVTRLQTLLTDPNRSWLPGLLGSGDPSKTIGDLVGQGTVWLAAFIRSLWSGGKTLISIFSLMVVTPVVAFYLICDWPRMVGTVDEWIPLPHRDTVHRLAHEINVAIAGFVRGQTGVCLILGSFYALSLTLVGLNFGLLIGFISGLISFIPYVGSMTGLVLGTSVAIAQFWPDWSWILVVLGVFVFGQFVEGYVLAPKLVGQNIGLHPVWLMFAMFAFGYLFGFVGLLVAVPLAAASGVLARFLLRQYRASALYTGVIPG